ncbi:hypothetical protein ABIB06_006541 [Bradyrhizobium sp. LB8.2]|uniref:hypothetical protein n=1 Tax=unclassified Bradyrhizobium TaxID=2631580 RepID=UPI003399C653
MTTYTTLADASLAQDKPLTQSNVRALRDNPLAIAEATSGAPAISGVNPGTVQTASASATLTFTNLPTKDLIEFELISLKPATSGAVLQMQVSTNNGSSWVTNYSYAKRISEVSTGGVASSTQEGEYTGTKVDLSQTSGGVNNGSNNPLCGVVQLFSAGSTTLVKQLTWSCTHANNTSSGIAFVSGGGFVGVATSSQINAVKFYFSSGNITNGSIAMRSRRNTATN